MKTFTLADFLFFFDKNLIQINPRFHKKCKTGAYRLGNFSDNLPPAFHSKLLGGLTRFREKGLVCGNFRRAYARGAWVSAKPWHFRRHRTAENARVKPRPKVAEFPSLNSVASPAFEPSFTIGNALRKAPAIFRASNPKNRAFLKNCVSQKRGQIFRHRVGKFAWVSLLLFPWNAL